MELCYPLAAFPRENPVQVKHVSGKKLFVAHQLSPKVGHSWPTSPCHPFQANPVIRTKQFSGLCCGAAGHSYEAILRAEAMPEGNGGKHSNRAKIRYQDSATSGSQPAREHQECQILYGIFSPFLWWLHGTSNRTTDRCESVPRASLIPSEAGEVFLVVGATRGRGPQ
eukprot:scaffold878_cov271-Pinguiococcus_pyrenoidosus.AAC.62